MMIYSLLLAPGKSYTGIFRKPDEAKRLSVLASLAPLSRNNRSVVSPTFLLYEPVASINTVTFLCLANKPSAVAFTAPSVAAPTKINSSAGNSLSILSARGSANGSKHRLKNMTCSYSSNISGSKSVQSVASKLMYLLHSVWRIFFCPSLPSIRKLQ